MSTLKWGQMSSSAIIRAILQTVFLFSLWSNNKMFFNNLKRVDVFQKAKLNMIVIKEHPCDESFYGFYKDKHRKICAILAEILPQLG